MKLGGRIGTWSIICLLTAAAMLSAALLRAFDKLPEYALGASLALGVIVLWIVAIGLSRKAPRLNLTVAAETIVALGIFSLVISMGASVYLATAHVHALDLSNLQPLVLPFLEGLVTAALAPVLATVLRNIEAAHPTVDSPEAGMQEAVDASGELAKQLKLAVDQLKTVTAAFASLNSEIDTQTTTFNAATSSAAKAAGDLVATLNTETTKLKGSLSDFQADARGLAEAARESREALQTFRSQVAGVTVSTKETDEAIKALSALIISVERFVRPETAAA